ncbi:TolC family protein [Lewinella sp. IMCC34183]|uniref:TolC family protein n=1 Tax=Lewinella sp. IMCC34183 TaxID=2248762 RepID=UPI0018E540AB|nr:TolC family protein [Lewinella sp. IMCC34183]
MKYLLVLFLSLPLYLAAQELPTVLREDEFLSLVAEHHPLAVRADLQRDRAEAVLRQARGGFDPYLYGDLAQKYFKGTRYYSVAEGGLSVPTWFGVQLKAAYERNEGYYLNPEHTVPEGGLFAAGLSVSLGQGLLFDERRAELRRAEVFQRASEAERQIQLNKLLFDAGKLYWDWAGAQGAVQVYAEAVELATTRYEFVVESARLGALPAIDTLEAGILLQNRELGLQTARLDLANATAALNAFLWIDGVVPLELEPTARPPEPASVEIAPVAVLPTPPAHPLIAQQRLNLETYEIDQRLQREQLKPRIDVSYNALMAGNADRPLEDYSAGNYKWGVTFKQSLLLRKERGKLQLTQIKLSEARLKLSDQIADLGAQVVQAESEVNVTVSQYALARRNAEDYEVLLAGERELFQAGESSLFLVNNREVSFIEANLKQLELMVKHRKARLARNFALGRTFPPADGGGPIE